MFAFVTRFGVAAVNEVGADAHKSFRVRFAEEMIDVLPVSFRMRYPAVRLGVADFDSRRTRRALLGGREIFNPLRPAFLFFHFSPSTSFVARHINCFCNQRIDSFI